MFRSKTLNASSLPADQRGNVAVIAALSIIPILSIAGLAIDMRLTTNSKNEVQAITDSAMLAAARDLQMNRGTRTATLTAGRMLNPVFQSKSGTTCDSSAPLIDDNGTSVSATFKCRQETTVSAVIGREQMPFLIKSKAAFQSGSTGCVLALGNTDVMGVRVWGSVTFAADGCSVISNTGGAGSVAVGGAGTLQSECVYAVGAIQTNGGLTTECASVVPYTSPTADPYAHISTPDNVNTMPCQTPVKNKSTGITYFPSGRYCGSTYSVSGTGVLEEGGIFYFDNATLKLQSSNASLSGSEVTLIFMNGGTLSTANGGKMELSSKTSGPWAGVLMYGDRNTGPSSISIEGNQTSSLQGALYFPSTDLVYRGGASLTGGCTQLVARTIDFSGNAKVFSECEDQGTATFGPAGEVYLVY